MALFQIVAHTAPTPLTLSVALHQRRQAILDLCFSGRVLGVCAIASTRFFPADFSLSLLLSDP